MFNDITEKSMGIWINLFIIYDALGFGCVFEMEILYALFFFLFLFWNYYVKSILYAGSEQQKVVISNSHGEKLVGILHETGSRELVVFCHGFRSSKVGSSND